MGPNLPEITQNPKIMIPYVTRDILVPHTYIMPNILMCSKHNKVGKSSFFPLVGTHFDPIWVQMYPKSPKIPKSYILMLLGSFGYPMHAPRYDMSPKSKGWPTVQGRGNSPNCTELELGTFFQRPISPTGRGLPPMYH